jgi:membrane protease YdiL (CAAX protease family)
VDTSQARRDHPALAEVAGMSSSTPTLTSPPASWWQRGVKLLVTDPLDRIDASHKADRIGRLDARAAAVLTAVVGCLMLVFLRFVVMDRGIQGGVASTVAELAGLFSDDARDVLYRYHRVLTSLSWVFGCFFCYFIVPSFIVRAVFGMRLSDFYLAPRDYLRHLPIYMALFTPVGLLVLLVVHDPHFMRQYPFYKDHVGMADLIAWELGYGLQFFALEFFFRGFLLRGTSAAMGAMSVLFMTVPYCMIHFGKPLPECVGSIIAGLVLGVLAMDTRSIWGGVTVHVAVAWSMDLAALWKKGAFG